MKEIELVDKRTKYEKHFLKDNGTIVARMYENPIHYICNGKMKDIDNQLIYSNGEYKNKYNSFKICFDKEYLFKINKDNYFINIKLLNEKVHAFDICKENCKLFGKGIYRNILDKIDIEYIIYSNKIKENIIIKDIIPDLKELCFQIETNVDLVLSKNKIVARDNNEIAFLLSEMFAIDSNDSIFNGLEYRLVKERTGYLLKVILDKDWFNSKERKYPIIIDPTITNVEDSDSVIDTYISSKYPNYNYSQTDKLQVGNWITDDNTDDIYRILLKFKLPNIGTGCQIVDAEVRLVGYPYYVGIYPIELLEIHRLTQDWQEGQATWNNMYNKFDSRIETIFNSMCSTMVDEDDENIEYVENRFNITNLVKKWYVDTPNYGIMIKAASEDTKINFLPKFFSKENIVSGDNPKPLLEITYKNQNGLESYMDYFKKDLTEGGIFFNTSNGNVTFSLNLVSSKSLDFPVTLSLIYNTNDVVLQNNENNLGNGFRFNLNQKLIVTNQDNVNLCYIDKDGTSHYFIDSKEIIDENGELEYETIDNTYYDEDGLNLTITKFDTYYILKDSDGTSMKFVIAGSSAYLTEIENNFQDKISIIYDADYNIVKIKDSINDEINIEYNENVIKISGTRGINILNLVNGKIMTISNANGTYQFTYDENKGVLNSVKDINGIKYVCEYYDVSPYKIKKVFEYNIDETSYRVFEFKYGYDTTTLKDFLGRDMVFCYNENGNIMSVIIKNENSDISKCYGATYRYGDFSQYVNKLISSSNITRPIYNLISDSSYEINSLRESPFVTVTNNNIIAEISSDYSHSGNKSLKINCLEELLEYREKFHIYNEIGDYTFSAFIKNTVSLKMFAEFENSDSEIIRVESEIIKPNTNFSRFDFNFKIESSQEYVTIGYQFIESGISYFDDIQLENSPIVNEYNYINKLTTLNNFSNEWELSNSNLITLAEIDGVTAIKVNMKPDEFTDFSKKLNISGLAGDKYTICFWYKNKGIKFDDPNHYNNVMVSFNYDLGDEYFDGHCILPGEILNPNEDEWQFYMESFTAEYNYTSLEVLFFQEFDANELYVANISLFRGCRAVYYNYNNDGLVTTEISELGNMENYIYNDNNQLLAIKDSNGRSITYEYLKHGNEVYKSFSPMNFTTELIYDENMKDIITKASNISNIIDVDGNYNIRCSGTSNYLKNIEKNLVISEDKYIKDFWNLESIVIDNIKYYKIKHSIINDSFISIVAGDLTISNYKGDNSLFELIRNDNGSYSIKSKISDSYIMYDDDLLLSSNYKNNGNFDFYFEKNQNKFFSEKDKIYNNRSKLVGIIDELLNKTIVEIEDDEDYAKVVKKGKNKFEINYDSKGRVTSKIKNGKEIKYFYNDNGMLYKISTNNREFTIGYNGYLKKNSVYLNDTVLIDNVRDNVDNNIIKTNTPNGNIYFEYDDFGRLIKKTKTDNVYNYFYDNCGNLVKILSNSGYEKYYYSIEGKLYSKKANNYCIDYDYDLNGNLSKKLYSIGDNEYVIDATYDEDNNLINTIFENNMYKTNFDSIQRVHSIEINNNNLYKKDYYKKGNRVSTLIKAFEIKNDKYILKYDDNLNIISISKNGIIQNKYKYDLLGQLVEESNYERKITIRYKYDLLNNMVSKDVYKLDTFELLFRKKYLYSSEYVDRLINYDNLNISYDDLGNIIKIDDDILSWSNGKELIQYKKGNSIFNYQYDDNSNRIRKVINGITTNYILENSEIVYEETNGSKIFYIREFNGNIIGFKYNNVNYYYIKDVFDSVIGIQDELGNLIASYEYDSWGNIISITDSFGNELSDNTNHIACINPYRFRSYYYDNETNLYYLGSRYYNPLFGRFISTDFGVYDDTIGCNLYIYCGNNPICKKDIRGKWFVVAVALVGGAINLASHMISNKINKKKTTLQDGAFYFATGMLGSLVALSGHPIKGTVLTNGFDRLYDKLNEKIEQKSNGSNKRISSKQKWKPIVKDVLDVTAGTIMDTGIDLISSKMVSNVIPASAGREPYKFVTSFVGKKIRNHTFTEANSSFVSDMLSNITDTLIDETFDNFFSQEQVVDTNLPMCGLQDDRHYLRAADE